jgi:hypothetical protein
MYYVCKYLINISILEIRVYISCIFCLEFHLLLFLFLDEYCDPCQLFVCLPLENCYIYIYIYIYIQEVKLSHKFSTEIK